VVALHLDDRNRPENLHGHSLVRSLHVGLNRIDQIPVVQLEVLNRTDQTPVVQLEALNRLIRSQAEDQSLEGQVVRPDGQEGIRREAKC
jgi:hypothetical protein